MKLTELLTNPRFTKKFFRGTLLIILITIAVIFGLFNTEKLLAVVNTLFGVFYPFILGICIAFVLNVILKMYEEHVFAFLNRKKPKLWMRFRRTICIVLTYLTVLAIFTGVVFFVLPELYQSLVKFADNIPSYLRSVGTWVVGNLYNATVMIASSIASGMFTFVMSMIFSVYMLSQKEHLLRGLKRVLYAFLPPKHSRRIIEISAITNRIFSGFVAGQLTESLILGVLCYLGMSIIRLPYALLISTIVCVCSLIPLLGAYISLFTGAFILLISTPWGSFPWDSLWFVVFLLLLQQFEGNVIYPRVVGTSIGLPGIWVLLAVIVCSGLMGIAGILIGIPATSVLYALFTQSVKNRLSRRHISAAQLDEEVDVEAILGRPAGGGPISNIKESRRRRERAKLAKLLEKTHDLTGSLHRSGEGKHPSSHSSGSSHSSQNKTRKK